MAWSQFVDFVTIAWLFLFFIGIVTTGYLSDICGIINLMLLSVFMMDLVFICRRSKSFSQFFKKHWFDVLLVIPFFRIFRAAKMLRGVKAVKAIGALKKVKGVKAIKIGRKAKALKSFKVKKKIKQGLDTIRVSKRVKRVLRDKK